MHSPCRKQLSGFNSHAFSEHTRAEYVRAYEADARAIRVREEVFRTVENALDEPVSVAGEWE